LLRIEPLPSDFALDAIEYDKLARLDKDLWYFKGSHQLFMHFLKRGGLKAPQSILDAGCGAGGFLSVLRNEFRPAQACGIDCSAAAVAYARNVHGDGIAQASVEALPFEGERFDLLTSIDVLCILENDDMALAEFHRVLKPGGVLLLNLPAYRWMWSYHDVAVHTRKRYNAKELNASLVRSGFRVVFGTYWNSLLFPLILLRRKLLPPPKTGSDVQELSGWLNAVLYLVLKLEICWFAIGLRFPFGLSRSVVCVKASA
jgi:SAM-dependent methyltransferase